MNGQTNQPVELAGDSAPLGDWARLAPLVGRPIAFHRRLVDVTTSVKAALLLAQMLYWVRHGREGAPGGWFYKTAAQWRAETGLSVHEQTSARRRLRRPGRGTPRPSSPSSESSTCSDSS